jgi:hypothetical protein
MMPENVRDSRMPISRPPMSVPITRLRWSSVARVAAYGTSICTTTEVMPTPAASAPRTSRAGAAALATSARVSMVSSAVSSGRRRVMSPAGTTSSRATAYPSCAAVTRSDAAAWDACSEDPMACSSGCA